MADTVPRLKTIGFCPLGHVKSMINKEHIANLAELKVKIQAAVSSVHKEMLYRTWAAMERKWVLLIACGGRHIEA